MKKILRIVLLAVCIPVFANYPSSTSSNDSYDIAGIYEKIELEDGAKAVDSYGNITDAEAVLVPAKFQTGNFEVELTRVDGNFYQICGTSQYTSFPQLFYPLMTRQFFCDFHEKSEDFCVS